MFVWRVSLAGYQWERPTLDCWSDRDQAELKNLHRHGRLDLETRVLTTTFSGHTEEHNEYQPLANAALFRTFAELGTDPAKYLKFANDFGHLTDEIVILDPLRHQRQSDAAAQSLRWPNGMVSSPWRETGGVARLERLSLWEANATEMAALIRRWEHAANSKTGEVERRQVYSRVEDHLRSSVSLVFSKLGSLTPRPSNLLSALWLQFAQSLSGTGEFRQCDQCKTWFLVSGHDPGHGRATRADKRFCSDPCRQAAAYLRRKEIRKKASASGRKPKPPKA